MKFGIPELHENVDDIVKNKDSIAGFVFHLDIWSPKYAINSLDFLDKLNKDFVLVSIDVIPYSSGSTKLDSNIKYANSLHYSRLCLLYINKNVLDSYYIPLISNNTNLNILETEIEPISELPISRTIILYEKVKRFYLELNKIISR